MTMTIGGTSGLVFPDSSTQNTAATGFGFKNRILNGNMVLDQRNAGASVTPTNQQYLVDRWVAGLTQASKFSSQQNAGSVTPPAGFTNYLGITSLSAYSVISSDIFYIQQRIEGFNLADLGWGTANASSVTLSFKVYSSLTGTFGGAIYNNGGTRSYPFTYTISSANTWTTISVTIAGDTSGTWVTNNGIGATLSFNLGAGSTYSGTAGSWASAFYTSATGATSVVGTSGATFYITGVQLEKGSTATSFDYRPYGTELALCQRYAYKMYASASNNNYLRYGLGQNVSTTQTNCVIPFPVSMRTSPTYSPSAANLFILYTAGATPAVTATTLDSSSPYGASINATVASGLVSGGACAMISGNNTTSYMLFEAEL